MRKLLIICGLCFCALSVHGQKGITLGIQSNYGLSSMDLVASPPGLQIESRPGFATGGSMFLQWNLTDRFGMRIQAEGMYQGLVYSAVNPINSAPAFFNTISYYENSGQFGLNLQASYGIPLNQEQSLWLEAFAGAGLRVTGTGVSGCGVSGSSGVWDTNDSVITTFISASRSSQQGTTVDVLGGVRMKQRLNASDKRPIWLSLGIGYRSTVSPLLIVEGAMFVEETIIEPQNPNVPPLFDRWQNGDVCDGIPQASPDERFEFQHLGRQIDMQVGLQFGI